MAPLAVPVVDRGKDHRRPVSSEGAEDAEIDEVVRLVKIHVVARDDEAKAEDLRGRVGSGHGHHWL